MLEIVAVVFDAAEGDAAKAVDFKDELGTGRGSANVDVGFLAHTNAIACAVEDGTLEVSVESEVIEAAIGEAISVIWVPEYQQEI